MPGIETQRKIPGDPEILRQYTSAVEQAWKESGKKNPEEQKYMDQCRRFQQKRLEVHQALDDFKKNVLVEYLRTLEQSLAKKEKVEHIRSLIDQIDESLGNAGVYEQFTKGSFEGNEQINALEELTENLIRATETLQNLKKIPDRTNLEQYIQQFTQMVRDLGDIPGIPDTEKTENSIADAA